MLPAARRGCQAEECPAVRYAVEQQDGGYDDLDRLGGHIASIILILDFSALAEDTLDGWNFIKSFECSFYAIVFIDDTP